LLDEAQRAVMDTGRPSGPLTLGSLETTAAVRLPRVLSAYAAAYPAVDLVLLPGTTAELTERVVSRELDGAFVCAPVQHPDLMAETVFREKLVLVTAPTVRSVDALKRMPNIRIVVLRVGCSYRQRIEDLLAGWGIVGLRRLEFGTLDAILGCVAAGIGITLLPKAVLVDAVDRRLVRTHALPPREAEVETLFIRRKDAYVSSALTAFLAGARNSRTGLADAS
jgi:LysR family transcriptional regulator, cell division regulator